MVIAVAQNQVKIAEAAHQYGAIQYLGKNDAVSADDILRSLHDAIMAPDRMRLMSAVASTLVDGGGTELVVQALNRT
jgi:hypothetical protein